MTRTKSIIRLELIDRGIPLHSILPVSGCYETFLSGRLQYALPRRSVAHRDGATRRATLIGALLQSRLL